MWHMKCSLSLTVWDGKCFEDIFTKDDSVTDLISDGPFIQDTESRTMDVVNFRVLVDVCGPLDTIWASSSEALWTCVGTTILGFVYVCTHTPRPLWTCRVTIILGFVCARTVV